jgi:hypothetical protein
MIQLDGSEHAWFDDRGPKCTLMGYIDDATSQVHARFYEYEGTIPALDSFRRYVSLNGLPQSVYLDRHSTYKSPGKPSIEDELNDRQPMSHFERALQELEVRVIHAYSPQAKGRIERLFGTFQDRVIKEMRLEKVSSISEGNVFMEKYLPRYNKRFGVAAAAPADLHRPAQPYQDLLRVLCIREERTVRNDATIYHARKHYQIMDRTWAKKVIVEQRLDGRLVIRNNDRNLQYREITRRELLSRRVHESEPVQDGIRIGNIQLAVAVKGAKVEKFAAPSGACRKGASFL